MKKIGFKIFTFVVTLIVYCVFIASRLVKAPLWWLPLNDFGFYVRSREINLKQKADEGIITQKDELLQDVKWMIPTIIFIILYQFIGLFWLMIVISLVVAIGLTMFFLTIRKKLKE